MAILWFGLGVLVGSIVTGVIICIRSGYGALRIDRSNPDKDVYRLDINEIDNLHKKKRVWLKVDSKADLSQK